MTTKINLMSFDIGIKNFAFYVEEFDYTQIQHYDSTQIQIKDLYQSDYLPTPQFETILQQVYKSGKTILNVNKNLSRTTTDTPKFGDQIVYYKMIQHMNEYKHILDTIDIFIIEKQLTRNIKATLMMQNIFCYLLYNYGDTKEIYLYPSYNKTCVLGAPRNLVIQKNGKQKWKTLGNKERKKWAVEKAYHILSLRNESDVLNNIKSKTKKDDLSDTIVQLQAFKIQYYIFKNFNK